MTINQRIIDWNKKRNGLEFDIALEQSMLTEEAREFFMANTLAERLQEYSDFVFVSVGTRAKFFSYSSDISIERFVHLKGMMDIMFSWMDDFCAEAIALITQEIISIAKANDTHRYGREGIALAQGLYDGALEAVVTANEVKGSEKNENGKIVKGDNYVTPQVAIDQMLADKLYSGSKGGEFVQ